MYDEVNTRCNLPAQIDIEAVEGEEYRFVMVAKGGGSANKTYFYPMTKARGRAGWQPPARCAHGGG